MTSLLRSAGVGTLIGRSYNIFKRNIKTTLKVLLIPLILTALEGVVNTIPTAVPTLVKPGLGQALIVVFSSLAIFVLAVVAFYTTVMFSCPLMRIYYGTITEESPPPLKHAIEESKKSIGTLIGCTMFGMVASIGFGIMDTILGLIGIFVFSAIVGASSVLMDRLGSPEIGTTVTMVMAIGMGTLMVVGGMAVLGLQLMICTCPLAAAALTPDGKPSSIGAAFGEGFPLLMANLPKAVLYGILLLVFAVVMAGVIHVPLYLWIIFELRRMGESVQPGTLPLHVSFVSNMVLSVLSAMVTPFILCAVTEFWYDCRVRKNGLDLRLWLSDMARRRTLRAAQAA